MKPHPLDALLPEICQLIDGCKADWDRQGCWSEWDQSVRDRITEYNLSRIVVADDDTRPPEPKLSELQADAKDAARYRLVRSVWFDFGVMRNINHPHGYFMHSISQIGDLESLDAVIDAELARQEGSAT